MATVIRQFLTCVVLTAALLVVGCTMTLTVPNVSLRGQGAEFAVNEKIDLAINLCLTEEFKGTKWEKHFPTGDTYVLPVGNQLAKNASELSEILFKEVVITCSPAVLGDNKPQAILTPKVVAIDRTFGFRTYHESILTLVVQWKLEDVRNNPIWIDSIKGEGRGKSQSILPDNSFAEPQVEMALKDLFGKSLQAFRTSPEIRQFVEKNRPAT